MEEVLKSRPTIDKYSVEYALWRQKVIETAKGEWPKWVVDVYLEHYNILKIGNEKLKRYRIEQHLKGEPTVYTPSKLPCLIPPPIVVAPYVCTQFGLTSLPHQLISTFVLPFVKSDRALFELSLTNWSLNGLVTKELQERATLVFPVRGTPKAFLLLKRFKHRKITERKKDGTISLKQLRTLLCLTDTQGLHACDELMSKHHCACFRTFIKLAITAHGYVDYIPERRRQVEQNAYAKQYEQHFVESLNIEGRVAKINASIGIPELEVEYKDNRCRFKDSNVEQALYLLSIDSYAFLKAATDFLCMKSESEKRLIGILRVEEWHKDALTCAQMGCNNLESWRIKRLFDYIREPIYHNKLDYYVARTELLSDRLLVYTETNDDDYTVLWKGSVPRIVLRSLVRTSASDCQLVSRIFGEDVWLGRATQFVWSNIKMFILYFFGNMFFLITGNSSSVSVVFSFMSHLNTAAFIATASCSRMKPFTMEWTNFMS